MTLYDPLFVTGLSSFTAAGHVPCLSTQFAVTADVLTQHCDAAQGPHALTTTPASNSACATSSALTPASSSGSASSPTWRGGGRRNGRAMLFVCASARASGERPAGPAAPARMQGHPRRHCPRVAAGPAPLHRGGKRRALWGEAHSSGPQALAHGAAAHGPHLRPNPARGTMAHGTMARIRAPTRPLAPRTRASDRKLQHVGRRRLCLHRPRRRCCAGLGGVALARVCQAVVHQRRRLRARRAPLVHRQPREARTRHAHSAARAQPPRTAAAAGAAAAALCVAAHGSCGWRQQRRQPIRQEGSSKRVGGSIQVDVRQHCLQ